MNFTELLNTWIKGDKERVLAKFDLLKPAKKWEFINWLQDTQKDIDELKTELLNRI